MFSRTNHQPGHGRFQPHIEGQFDFALDVTFTSDSGAFLTPNTTATPEPASLMLLGLGVDRVAVACRKG
jgi:hypothetical protein